MIRWLQNGQHLTSGIWQCKRYLVTGPVSSPPYKILFCGTDTFARTSLKALYDEKDLYSSITVLTKPDASNEWKSNKRAAKSPVKKWADEVDLEHHTVPREGIAEWQIPPAFLANDANALLLTASFGYLIPPLLTRHFPEAQRLNLHPSMLPELSGAAPIQWAIARQKTSTGVTVQGLGDFFDSGSVYAQREVNIPEASTYLSLEPILAEEGSRLLVDVLKDVPRYANESWPQSDAPKHLVPSKAAKLRSSMSEIRWKVYTASEIEARHRGFGYLYPLTTTLLGANKVIIREMSVIKDYSNLHVPEKFLEEGRSGHAMYSPKTKSLLVKCRKTERSLLSITKLQNEGKRQMAAQDWIVGYKDRRTAEGTFVFDS